MRSFEGILSWTLLCTTSLAFSVLPSCRQVVALRSTKDDFLQSLLHLDTLNEGASERTLLLDNMIKEKEELSIKDLLRKERRTSSTSVYSASNPASLTSMLPIAPGTWKVVYAPHMTTIAKLAGANQDVSYIMCANQSITSHAKFTLNENLPIIHFSVSGRYDSVSDHVCSVEWTDTWVRIGKEETPFAQLADVPESISKSIINNIGRMMFIQPFSVFPVSFLSHDLTVFDFELLGTRICARKIES